MGAHVGLLVGRPLIRRSHICSVAVAATLLDICTSISTQAGRQAIGQVAEESFNQKSLRCELTIIVAVLHPLHFYPHT